MKEEWKKVRNKLLLYSLILSSGVALERCSMEESNLSSTQIEEEDTSFFNPIEEEGAKVLIKLQEK